MFAKGFSKAHRQSRFEKTQNRSWLSCRQRGLESSRRIRDTGHNRSGSFVDDSTQTNSTCLETVTCFFENKIKELPSEKTVKQLLAPFIVHNFVDLATGGTMREIRKHLFGANTLPSVQWEKPDAIKHAA